MYIFISFFMYHYAPFRLLQEIVIYNLWFIIFMYIFISFFMYHYAPSRLLQEVVIYNQSKCMSDEINWHTLI